MYSKQYNSNNAIPRAGLAYSGSKNMHGLVQKQQCSMFTRVFTNTALTTEL